MYQVIELDEEMTNQFIWIMLHQYGLKIDDIKENGEIYGTVPSFSTYMVKNGMTLPGMNRSIKGKDEMVAGETLRAMCTQIFEDLGLQPHIGIRSENWNEFLGEINGMRAQQMIDEGLHHQ